MKLPTRIAPRRAAFTIIEVIVAMAILLIGMTSILGLLSFGAAMTRNALLKSTGSTAIDALSADLEESAFPLKQDEKSGEWIVGEPSAIVDRAVPDHPGITYSARATPDTSDKTTRGGALRWKFEIEMRWTTAGQARSRKFTTLLLRQVPFGERLRRELIQGEPPPSAAQPTKLP